VPEDRQRDGLIGTFTVAANMVLNQVNQAPFSRRGRIDRGAVQRHAEQLVEAFDVRTPSINANASTLSGGNQQKVIVAAEFFHARRLLVLSQPTRGLDVGSIQYIHRQVVAKRDEGWACW
jgi:simple sugar transport system ATP-binding protein